MFVQVNLFQKLATSPEQVVYQNCSECQKNTHKKTLIFVHNIFCRYSEVTTFINNEQLQSAVIFWVIVDAKVRVSDKDLPVKLPKYFNQNKICFYCSRFCIIVNILKKYKIDMESPCHC
jgi:hypothetical protein